MRKNWYDKSIHIGTQPIRVLTVNILQWYENTYPDFRKDLKNEITYNGLQKSISYFIGENPIQEMPLVDEKKTIIIEESFLSYLWIVAYSIIVLYDEIVTKPKTSKGFKYISDAEKLFSYGLSLIRVFTKWDILNLPNPEFYDKKENEYIEKINGVFLSAVNFVLIHEFSHVSLGHVDLDRENLKNEKTFTIKELINQELSADKFAIESLLLSKYSKTNLHVIKAGIIVGLIALLFFDSTMKGEKHPDPDDRIKKAIESMNLEPNDDLWGIACMGFKQWSKFYNVDLAWPLYMENYQKLFYYNIEKLKRYK